MSTRRSRVRSPGSAAPAGDEPKEGRKEYCRENPSETADYRWRWLYRAGGAAALFGVALIPIQLLVFVAWGQPVARAPGLRAIVRCQRYVWHRDNARPLCRPQTCQRVSHGHRPGLGLVDAVALIVARPAFEMLYLSEQHAAATTDAQRDLFLAAGETVLATFHGTAFHISYNLFSVYLLMVSMSCCGARSSAG